MPPSVFITNTDQYLSCMFEDEGWDMVGYPGMADLIVFAGVAPTEPSLYYDARIANRSSQEMEKDTALALWCQEYGTPSVGIGGAAVFLHVLADGEMFHGVDGHMLEGSHPMQDIETGEVFNVSSVHSQMMRLSSGSTLVAHGYQLSTYKEFVDGDSISHVPAQIHKDVEVVFHAEANSLCYQPHPEHLEDESAEYFFSLIEDFFQLRGGE